MSRNDMTSPQFHGNMDDDTQQYYVISFENVQ